MKRHISTFVLVWLPVLTGAATFASGQGGQIQQTQEPPKQAYCPMAPDVEIDPEVFTDYKGQRCYFCCDRCKIKFTRQPEKYAARLVGGAATQTPQTGGADHPPGHAHGHDDAPKPPPSAEEQKDADHHHAEVAGQPADADHHHDEPGAMPMGGKHDHKEHGPSTGPRWQKWLGGFHPPMVNFPIGVLVAGSLAELLFIVRRRPEFDHVARFCVVFAVLTGVAAGILGWLFAGIRLADTDPLLGIHRWLGTGTVLWLLALLWFSERARRPGHSGRGLYRFCLFGGTALVTVTGFFGGAMVYGLDHYLWR